MVEIESIKVPLIGFGGAGAGIAVGTLAAEFTSRATGQTKWAACGVKALVKTGVGGIAYFVSTKIPKNASAAFFAEMFAYGSFGSILLDVALAAYPGGIPGLAEDWAVTVRVYAAGGKKVVKELGKIEGVGKEGMKPFPLPAEVAGAQRWF